MQARILRSTHLHQGDEDYYSFSIDWGEERIREVIVQVKDPQGNVLSREVKSEKLWEQKGSRGFNLIRHASPLPDQGPRAFGRNGVSPSGPAGPPAGEWELVGLLDRTIPRVLPHAIVLATQSQIPLAGPGQAKEAVQAMLPALQEEYLLVMSQPGPVELMTDKGPFQATP